MGDEAGEPEEHGDGLDGEDGKWMSGAGKKARREGEEGDDEESGPDAVEN